jgi:hypothetical protein
MRLDEMAAQLTRHAHELLGRQCAQRARIFDALACVQRRPPRATTRMPVAARGMSLRGRAQRQTNR